MNRSLHLSDLAIPAALLGAAWISAIRAEPSTPSTDRPTPVVEDAAENRSESTSRYHAFMSKPILQYSHRVGELFKEQEELGEMLEELSRDGHVFESILQVPEGRVDGAGIYTNRILVITRK